MRPPVSQSLLAAVLFGAGAAWNGGNIGPVVLPLSEEFSVSLSAVGLLSGTVFFGGIVASTLLAAPLAGRIGFASSLRLACVCAGAGNVLFAITPVFAGLVAGRVLAGIALGLAFSLGPVFARTQGGVRLVGAFGASIMIGIAAALGVGGVLHDAGVDWRAGFVISAIVGLAALPFFPARVEVEAPQERVRGHFTRDAMRSSGMWRLALLFAATLSVPMVLSGWLIHYLTQDGGIAPALAAGLAFLLFVLSAALRAAGGRLSARGVSPVLLAGIAPLLASVGLVGLGVERSFLAALLAVVLMAPGFAFPYAAMMDEAQRLFPGQRLAAVAYLSVIANSIPIALIPAVGAALEHDLGEESFIAMAGFLLLAGLANLRPAAPPQPVAER